MMLADSMDADQPTVDVSRAELIAIFVSADMPPRITAHEM